MLNKGVVSLAYTTIENLSCIASKSSSLSLGKVTTFGRDTDQIWYLYGRVTFLYASIRNRNHRNKT